MSDSTGDAFYTLFELIGQISSVSHLSVRQFEMPGRMNRCLWTAITCVVQKEGSWYERPGGLAPFFNRVLEYVITREGTRFTCAKDHGSWRSPDVAHTRVT